MIYCVEDDLEARDMMLYALNASGFETAGFADAALFWSEMDKCLPELILLDIMLPGEDGITVLKKLKSSPLMSKIPVIMTTAKGTEFDKVTGLDFGADDYLVKPFGMMELVSRIRAVLRRTSSKEGEAPLTVGDITMYDSEHKVCVAGEQIILTLKEYEMLRLLMNNPGKVYTRDMLLSVVWGGDFTGETRTVDVHIGTLRTKLGESGGLIRTVRGVGYAMERSL